MKRLLIPLILLTLYGCEPPKKAVELLTFAEKKQIFNDCQRNGQIVTDRYCKEVAYVYQREEFAQRSKAHDDQAAKDWAHLRPSLIQPN